MRRRSLRIWTWLIVATAVAVAVGEKIAERVYGMDWLDAEVVAALLAALAGALAIVFQRRNEFIDSLRAVWADCLAAIGHLRTLYMREACSEQQILEAYRSLSVAIDSMRAVYRNVGETDRHIGFYPFETLHDLRRMLEADFMSGTTPDAATRLNRRAEISGMWRLFRTAFLRELDTPEPATPVLRAGATDMRMRGASLLNRMRIRAQDRNESKQGDDPE